MTEPQLPEQPPVTDQGKMLALLSYASLYVGLPLFVVPMIMRDDAFALYHAKLSGVLFIGYLVTLVVVIAISVITCGFGSILVFLMFLWWIPALFGVIDALGGKTSPMPVVSDLAETLFGGVRPKLEGE